MKALERSAWGANLFMQQKYNKINSPAGLTAPNQVQPCDVILRVTVSWRTLRVISGGKADKCSFSHENLGRACLPHTHEHCPLLRTWGCVAVMPGWYLWMDVRELLKGSSVLMLQLDADSGKTGPYGATVGAGHTAGKGCQRRWPRGWRGLCP